MIIACCLVDIYKGIISCRNTKLDIIIIHPSNDN